MGLYEASAFISFAGLLILSAVPVIKDKKNRLNLWLAAFNFAAALWQLDMFLLRTVATLSAADMVSRMLRPALLALPFILLAFVVVFVHEEKNKKINMIKNVSLMLAATTIVMNFAGVGFGGCVYKPGYGYVPVGDVIYKIFLFNLLLGVAASVAILVKKYNSGGITAIEKKKLQYFLIAFFIAVIAGASNILNIFGFEVYMLGVFGVLLYFITISYAILSYDILNIRELLQKVIMYLIISFLICVIYFIVFKITEMYIPGGMYNSMIYFLVTFFIVPAINPTLSMLDRFTKKIFFISNFDYNVLLHYVLNKIRFRKDMRQVLNDVLDNVVKIFGLKNSVFFFMDSEKKCYDFYGGFDTSGSCLEKNHPLIKYFRERKKTVYYKFLYDELVYYLSPVKGIENQDMREMIKFLGKFDAELCIPIMFEEEVAGVWIIGQKETKSIFSKQEINWLENIASQISVIIENISLYNKLVDSKRFIMLGEMAAAVAHEIRNPLTGISGFIQMIKSGGKKKNDIMEKFLEIAPSEFARLEKLTDNLLALSHTTKLEKQKVNLKEVVKEMNDLAAHIYRKNNVEIMEKIGQVPDIEADRKQIGQVILNIIMNSVQTMENGGSVLFEAGEKTVNNTEKIYLKISDTGPGINPDVKEKIFEAFYTTKANGTGLGLAISRRIMEAHDGSIEVMSEYGKGTSVILYFKKN